MNIKRVPKGCRKLTGSRARRNLKDTDSGISSASSIGTADTIELSPCVTLGIKVKDIVQGKCKTFSPVVVLERSKEAERQLQQRKFMYLQVLESHVHSDAEPKNIWTDHNKTGKDLISVASNNNKECSKYNLRKLDKYNVPTRFQDMPLPKNKNNTNTLNVDPPIKKEPCLKSIKIMKDLSDEKEIIKQNRQKKKKPEKRLHSMKTSKPVGKRHRKFWKRSNDVPSDVDCITSDHKIFQGAVLEEFPFNYLLMTKIKICCNSNKTSSNIQTPKKTLKNITMETPNKKVVIPSTSLAPPQIKITFSANLNNRTVRKIDFLSPSPELQTENNFSVQDTFEPDTLNENEINLKTKVIMNNNRIVTSSNNTVNGSLSDTESEPQKVSEPYTYKFKKFGSRLKRFNAVKLRRNMDKPINNCTLQKRNSASDNESSPVKKLKIVSNINTNEMKETGNDKTSPKNLLITPPEYVEGNILEKSGLVLSNDSTYEILEKSPIQNMILSPKKSLHVAHPVTTSKGTIANSLEKNSTQNPPDYVNYLSKPVEFNKNVCEVTYSKSISTKFDLQQHLSRQRSLFKTPLLPLTKRPPSRITAEILSRLDQIAIEQSNSNQDCDAISLFAESFCEAENQSHLNELSNMEKEQESPIPDTSTVEVAEENTKYNESESLDDPLEEFPETDTKCGKTTIKTKSVISQKSGSEHMKSTENFKSALQSLQESDFPALPSPSSEITSVNNNTSKVSEWIASASNESVIVSDANLDNTLKQFCCHFYKSRHCKYFEINGKCKFYHYVPVFFKKMIMDLRPNQFNHMYRYILMNLAHLFTEIFHLLVNYVKDQEKTLVDITKDVIHVTHLEKKPYVIIIISALKNLGLSFSFAVEEIFIAHNKKQWLMEILFDIVTSDQNCLENNWCLIQKLINSLQHNLDHGIISDIFNKCINTYPPNKELCKNVYIDLIVTDRLNLYHETGSSVNKYINLLRSFDLRKYIDHIQEKYNIYTNEETVYITEQSDDNVEEEVVSNTDIKEPTFSDSSSDTSMDRLRDTNISNISDDSSFEPYVPAIQEQNVAEYVLTQSLTAFNSLNQSYSYRNDSPVQQDSEQSNLENASNSSAGSVKNASKISSVKDDELPDFHHWASNKSISFSDLGINTPSNDVTDNDIKELHNALKEENISMVLSLFVKYSVPNLSKPFVIHLIIALKNLNDPDLVEFIVKNIFCGFERLGTTFLTLKLANLLQLFGFNVLTYFDCFKKYEVAYLILKKFPNYSDFITTECIDNFEYLSTLNFRYLFIFKVLTRNGKYRDALMFLKSLDLKVNESLFSDENPLKYLEYKKRLMCEFMDETLEKNIPVAKDMLCFIILEVRSYQCIDFEKYLNSLLINMLNHYSEFKLELTDIFQIIISSWYKYLMSDVLRALFVQLYNELSDWKILELYRINVMSKVYEAPEGNANSISIPSNLMKEEIYILLHMYFNNLSKSNYPVKNIIIDIKSVMWEESEDTSISVLTDSRTNYIGMKNRILNVLNKFPYPPASYCETDQCILLTFEEMRPLLDYYRSEILPPLQKF